VLRPLAAEEQGSGQQHLLYKLYTLASFCMHVHHHRGNVLEAAAHCRHGIDRMTMLNRHGP